MENYEIRVWVGNLGRYNEGDLVGGWITLPQTAETIETFLHDTVGINDRYEEYALFDWEQDGALSALNLKISEYEDLYALNVLAYLLKNESGSDCCDAVKIAGDMSSTNDPLEYANLAAQWEDISYAPYTDQSNPCLDENEQLAYSLIESGALPELKAVLDGPYGTYIDIAKLGYDLSMDFYTSASGYIDASADLPDVDLYSLQELADMVYEATGEHACPARELVSA